MVTDWRTGYFEQARSDFEMLLRLMSMKDSENCHRLHYLQMSTEKLAKGFKCKLGDMTPPELVHPAFAGFVQKQAKQNPMLRRLCRIKKQQAYGEYLRELLPLAQRIEGLAPSGANVGRANPEYPWMVRGRMSDSIEVPASHSFLDWDFKGNEMRKMLDFIRACFAVAQQSSTRGVVK